MSGFEIEKEIARLEKKQAKWDKRDARQLEREAFVKEHDLACYQCGTRMNEWASAKYNQWGKPSALCVRCQRDKWRNAA